MSPRLDYEALIAGLPDAVVGVDDSLRVMLWNPAAEALLGRSARRTIGRVLKEVFPPETSLVRHLGDTLATGESRSEAEAVIERGDGRYELNLGVENSSALAGGDKGFDASIPGVPLFRRFEAHSSPVLRDGQSVQTVASTDPVTGEVVKIDVTLNVLN